MLELFRRMCHHQNHLKCFSEGFPYRRSLVILSIFVLVWIQKYKMPFSLSRIFSSSLKPGTEVSLTCLAVLKPSIILTCDMFAAAEFDFKNHKDGIDLCTWCFYSERIFSYSVVYSSTVRSFTILGARVWKII